MQSGTKKNASLSSERVQVRKGSKGMVFPINHSSNATLKDSSPRLVSPGAVKGFNFASESIQICSSSSDRTSSAFIPQMLPVTKTRPKPTAVPDAARGGNKHKGRKKKVGGRKKKKELPIECSNDDAAVCESILLGPKDSDRNHNDVISTDSPISKAAASSKIHTSPSPAARKKRLSGKTKKKVDKKSVVSPATPVSTPSSRPALTEEEKHERELKRTRDAIRALKEKKQQDLERQQAVEQRKMRLEKIQSEIIEQNVIRVARRRALSNDKPSTAYKAVPATKLESIPTSPIVPARKPAVPRLSGQLLSKKKVEKVSLEKDSRPDYTVNPTQQRPSVPKTDTIPLSKPVLAPPPPPPPPSTSTVSQAKNYSAFHSTAARDAKKKEEQESLKLVEEVEKKKENERRRLEARLYMQRQRQKRVKQEMEKKHELEKANERKRKQLEELEKNRLEQMRFAAAAAARKSRDNSPKNWQEIQDDNNQEEDGDDRLSSEQFLAMGLAGSNYSMNDILDLMSPANNNESSDVGKRRSPGSIQMTPFQDSFGENNVVTSMQVTTPPRQTVEVSRKEQTPEKLVEDDMRVEKLLALQNLMNDLSGRISALSEVRAEDVQVVREVQVDEGIQVSVPSPKLSPERAPSPELVDEAVQARVSPPPKSPVRDSSTQSKIAESPRHTVEDDAIVRAKNKEILHLQEKLRALEATKMEEEFTQKVLQTSEPITEQQVTMESPPRISLSPPVIKTEVKVPSPPRVKESVRKITPKPSRSPSRSPSKSPPRRSSPSPERKRAARRILQKESPQKAKATSFDDLINGFDDPIRVVDMVAKEIITAKEESKKNELAIKNKVPTPSVSSPVSSAVEEYSSDEQEEEEAKSPEKKESIAPIEECAVDATLEEITEAKIRVEPVGDVESTSRPKTTIVYDNPQISEKKHRLSPSSLSRQLLAEVDYQDSLFETHLQIVELEHSQLVSRAQQEAVDVAQSWLAETESAAESERKRLIEAKKESEMQVQLEQVKSTMEEDFAIKIKEAHDAKEELQKQLDASSQRESCVQTEELKTATVGTDSAVLENESNASSSTADDNNYSQDLNPEIMTLRNRIEVAKERNQNELQDLNAEISSIKRQLIHVSESPNEKQNEMVKRLSELNTSRRNCVVNHRAEIASLEAQKAIAEAKIYEKDTQDDARYSPKNRVSEKNVQLEEPLDRLVEPASKIGESTDYFEDEFEDEASQSRVSIVKPLLSSPLKVTLESTDNYEDDSTAFEEQSEEFLKSESESNSARSSSNSPIESKSKQHESSNDYFEDSTAFEEQSNAKGEVPSENSAETSSDALSTMKHELESLQVIKIEAKIRENKIKERKQAAEELYSKKVKVIEDSKKHLQLDEEEKQIDEIVKKAMELDVQEEVKKFKDTVAQKVQSDLKEIMPVAVKESPRVLSETSGDEDAQYSDDSFEATAASKSQVEVESDAESSVPSETIENEVSEESMIVEEEGSALDEGSRAVDESYSDEDFENESQQQSMVLEKSLSAAEESGKTDRKAEGFLEKAEDDLKEPLDISTESTALSESLQQKTQHLKDLKLKLKKRTEDAKRIKNECFQQEHRLEIEREEAAVQREIGIVEKTITSEQERLKSIEEKGQQVIEENNSVDATEIPSLQDAEFGQRDEASTKIENGSLPESSLNQPFDDIGLEMEEPREVVPVLPTKPTVRTPREVTKEYHSVAEDSFASVEIQEEDSDESLELSIDGEESLDGVEENSFASHDDEQDLLSDDEESEEEDSAIIHDDKTPSPVKVVDDVVAKSQINEAQEPRKEDVEQLAKEFYTPEERQDLEENEVEINNDDPSISIVEESIVEESIQEDLGESSASNLVAVTPLAETKPQEDTGDNSEDQSILVEKITSVLMQGLEGEVSDCIEQEIKNRIQSNTITTKGNDVFEDFESDSSGSESTADKEQRSEETLIPTELLVHGNANRHYDWQVKTRSYITELFKHVSESLPAQIYNDLDDHYSVLPVELYLKIEEELGADESVQIYHKALFDMVNEVLVSIVQKKPLQWKDKRRKPTVPDLKDYVLSRVLLLQGKAQPTEDRLSSWKELFRESADEFNRVEKLALENTLRMIGIENEAEAIANHDTAIRDRITDSILSDLLVDTTQSLMKG